MEVKNVNSYSSFKNSLPEKQLFVERLTYALDFATRTIRHLIVEGHSAPESDPWHVRPEKIITESAFLIVYAKASISHTEVAKAIINLYKLVEPLARSKATLTNICLKPALALDYAHAHICLSYAGFPNTYFDSVIENVLNHKKNIERTPYRMLEQEWLYSIWKNTDNKNEIEFWTKLSCLNHSKDIFSESTDGVYALTHAVMYTYFTEKPSVIVDMDKLLSELEGLLIIYMDRQDYDIAGELLIAWALTNKPFSNLAIFALKCLIYIEKRVGFLPAPNLDLNLIEGKDQIERRTYIYSLNYHTVFVMGLLFASLLKNYKSLKIKTNRPNDFSKLNKYLNTELQKEKQVHWMEYFSTLNKEEKSELLPWIYQALLARKIKLHKYDAVKKMIDFSKGSYLEKFIITKQADELLNRLEYFSLIDSERNDLIPTTT